MTAGTNNHRFIYVYVYLWDPLVQISPGLTHETKDIIMVSDSGAQPFPHVR